MIHVIWMLFSWVGAQAHVAPEVVTPPMIGEPWVVIGRSDSGGSNPRLVVLPDGTFVAAVDHRPNCSGPGLPAPLQVFRSTDHGSSWSLEADLSSPCDASMFAIGSDIYLMGAPEPSERTNFGGLVIRRSRNEGCTWSKANDRTDGIIAEHVVHNLWPESLVAAGRVWRPFQERSWDPIEGTISQLVVWSAPVASDLLCADSWTTSCRIPIDEQDHMSAFLDVLALRGELPKFVVSCLDDKPLLRAEISADALSLRAAANGSAFRLPKRASRRKALHDVRTDMYFALTIPNEFDEARIDPHEPAKGFGLTSSPDGETWTTKSVLIEGTAAEGAPVGWSDWVIDGDDLVVVIETWGGSAPWSNATLFLRVPRFRERTLDTPPLWSTHAVK